MSKSEGQVLDFEKICRLCLLEKRSMSSIFAKKKSDKKVPLPVRIMSCASLELYEGDGLPASICSKCLLSVNQSYAFREQCEQADTTLRQYAQRMNDAGGETSTNREPREHNANDSLAHIEDFGIKSDELHGDEDEEEGNNVELNTGEVALSSVGNMRRIKEKEDHSKKGKSKESIFKEIILKEKNKFNFKEKKGLAEDLSSDSEGKMKGFISEGGSGMNEKMKKKTKNNSATEEFLKLSSLSKRNTENLIGTVDFPVLLEGNDYVLVGETGNYDDDPLTESKLNPKFLYGLERNNFISFPSNVTPNNKKGLELLQNLMKNKNIILKKRETCEILGEKIFRNQEFGKTLRCIKGLSLKCDFKTSQLLKEWEEVNKRIPKIAETKSEYFYFGKPEVHPVNDCSVDGSSQERHEGGLEEKVELPIIKDHPKEKFRISKDTVYCKDCRLFLLKSSYSNHIKFVHKKIRKYLCQTCGYAACTGTILRQHVQAVHVGYSFSCDQCPKKFNLMKRLRKHIEFHHSGKQMERNHVCQYCGMAFVKPGCLKRHLRSHTQETPYYCQYCQRRFKYLWPKKQHERLHTGEKPYKCSFCEERFTQNCVRKRHEYKKHGNEEFQPKIKDKEVNLGNL